jgi:glycosyltransferase involved in cell wall biosynthesis
VRDEAEALGVSESVRFLGSVEDVSGLLGAVDLGVFSSRSEGCPNGVLESMAAGLPLVATDVPAIRSVVGARGEAQLATMGDVEGFAHRIAAFAADPALSAAMGAENCTRVRESFGPERMCERMSGILARALMGQPTRPGRAST